MESSPSMATLACTVIAAAVTFLAITSISRWRRRSSSKNHPPGPKPWPVIGNLHLIGDLPHRSIHDLSRVHGPLMRLRFGSSPVVVASSASTAREVLRTHDVAFASRPRTAAGKYTTYDYSDMTWSPYGPYWRQARKMFLTELFSARRLDSFEYIRSDELRRLLRRLFESVGSNRPTCLKDHLSTLSLNVISRMVLGRNYAGGADHEGEEAPVSPEEFKEMLDELFLLNGVLNIGDWIPWLGFLDLQGYVGRMKKVSKKFDRFLEHVLDVHEERRRREGDDAFAPRDMVDVLLQLARDPDLEVPLTRNSVKAFTQDLIAGGTESTAVTVEWAISEMLRRPHILEKAAAELDSTIGRDRWVSEKDIPGAGGLPYIEAIMKETMRMHPVAPLLVPRLSREPRTVSGYDVDSGTAVLVNVWSIGRDPAIWGDPEEFRPERFLEDGGGGAAGIDVKGNHFELLPFGAGRRMCPGYALGLKVVQASLANLLQGFEWGLPTGMSVEELDMTEVFGLSTPRKVPLKVVLRPRLPAHFYE